MNYTEESLEFNLKDLLFYIFYRWKQIVIAAVLAAFVLGAVQAYPQYRSASGADSTEASRAEQEYYEQLEHYTQSVNTTKEKISAFQEYMDHSILVNANSQHVYIAKASYHIDSGYQIIPGSQYQNPNMTEALLWYYKNYLSDYSTYVPLAEHLGTEAQYLVELVKLSDSTNEILFIQVIHPDHDAAQAILNHLDEVLHHRKAYLGSTVAEHTLTQISSTCGIYTSETVANNQQKKAEQMLGLTQELNTRNNDLKQFKKDNAPDTAHVLSTFVKWAVVGGLAGGVLLVVLFFLLGIFDTRVYSPDYVSSRYRIPYLGGILPAGLRFDFITGWLRKLDCLLVKNSPENLQFLAANVENHLDGSHRILICNDGDPEAMSELADILREQLPDVQTVAAGSLLADAAAVRALPQCDRVLLVFNRNRTNHKYIRKTLDQIRECGKEAMGFIFVG